MGFPFFGESLKLVFGMRLFLDYLFFEVGSGVLDGGTIRTSIFIAHFLFISYLTHFHYILNFDK